MQYAYDSVNLVVIYPDDGLVPWKSSYIKFATIESDSLNEKQILLHCSAILYIDLYLLARKTLHLGYLCNNFDRNKTLVLNARKSASLFSISHNRVST